MKAFEFPAILNPDGTLQVPGSVASSLPQGEAMRLLVLIPENQGDDEWEHLAAMEFGQGYADGDAIYDQLSSR
jgi:hypothetical protein